MEIRLQIPVGYSWFFFDEIPDDAERRLENTFRYRVEDAEYTDSFKSGDWNGYINVYSTKHSGGPVGLIPRVTDMLHEMGHTTLVEWNGDHTGTPVDLTWTFDGSLREYQHKAVNALMENNGGVISLPTGTGKTLVALCYLFYERKRLGRPIIFVHSKNLLYQWEERVKDTLGVEPGLIGDGHFEQGPVTICIMQSLMAKTNDNTDVDDVLSGNYGIAVFDECHITAAAQEMSKTSTELDVRARVGLSATPWRNINGEELEIEGVVGDAVYSADAAAMIDAGYMSEPIFHTIEYGDEWPRAERFEGYNGAYERCVKSSDPRNKALTRYAIDLAQAGRQVFISVDRIEHGEHLFDRVDAGMDRLGMKTVVHTLYGDDSADIREDTFDLFAPGDILISTLLQEGVDIPEIDAIILAHAQASDITAIQTIGRALRPDGEFDDAKIVHVADEGSWLENAYHEREAALHDYYGI